MHDKDPFCHAPTEYITGDWFTVFESWLDYCHIVIVTITITMQSLSLFPNSIWYDNEYTKWINKKVQNNDLLFVNYLVIFYKIPSNETLFKNNLLIHLGLLIGNKILYVRQSKRL